MSGWIAAADAWGPPPPPPVPPTAPPTAPAPRRATAADKQAALEAEIEQLRRELTAAKRGEGRRKEGAASSLATQQQAVSAAATRLAEVHAMLTVAPLASLPDASAAAAVELAARKAAEAAEHLARVARLQGQMAATLKGGGGSATADPGEGSCSQCSYATPQCLCWEPDLAAACMPQQCLSGTAPPAPPTHLQRRPPRRRRRASSSASCCPASPASRLRRWCRSLGW